MLTLHAAAATDIGRVRRENQDRFLLDATGRLFGVADGIGGLPGGAEAAQLAVEAFARWMADDDSPDPDLAAALREANESVALLGRRISPAVGIGTTLTVGSLAGSALRLAHVGDSRCYAWRAGALELLTEDHSVENEVRRRRARGEQVYFQASQRGALTRCIGQPPPLEVDVSVRPLLAGDRYVFCTDGISRLVADLELRDLLAATEAPQDVVDRLVEVALRRGGPDNATAVAVYVAAG
ncbi:MAG: PP2C family protein-serine/threonine phosphatase [Opitutaceae bacterium]